MVKGKEIAEWLENEKVLGIESMDGEDPVDDPGNVLWIQYIDYLAAVAKERRTDRRLPVIHFMWRLSWWWLEWSRTHGAGQRVSTIPFNLMDRVHDEVDYSG